MPFHVELHLRLAALAQSVVARIRVRCRLYLAAVLRDGVLIGVAPLSLKDGEASFIGSADVCDYLDFIILPGREVDFFTVLLDDLKDRGVGRLNLGLLRPDSTVLSSLLPLV